MFSWRFTQSGLGVAGRAAPAADGFQASPSTRTPALGRNTIAKASLWPLPAMAWISIGLRASARTSFVVKAVNRGRRFDAARRSSAIVRGADHARSQEARCGRG